MPDTSPAALRAIRLLHTVVWLFFASLTVAIPITAYQRHFRAMLLVTALVMVEVLILMLNRMRCPLTGVAARYTDDRRDNFDIYLPLLIARYNKQIFGTILVAGLALGLVRWLT